MAPTTVTTICLIAFALALIAFGLYNLFGSWQPEPRRLSQDELVEAEYEAAVREMRRELAEYERGRSRWN